MAIQFKVDPEACRRCQRCAAAQTCPEKAFFNLEGTQKPFINRVRCTSCGDCYEVCPFRAIRIVSAATGRLAAD